MTGGNDATPLALTTEDDQYSAAAWEKAAAAVLRKAKRLGDDDADELVWDKLSRTTLDGIAITPLGTADLLDDLQTSGRPTRAGAWDIRARLAGVDPKAGNEAALVDLDGGVNSLWVATEDGSELATLLQGVMLDLAPVVLEAAQPQAAAEALLAVADAAGVDLHEGTNFGVDPIGDAIRNDGHPASAKQFLPTIELARNGGVRGVVVDATAVHDLGASDAQELGYALAVGAAYLRRLTESGLSIDEAADQLEFRFAATDEQFPTIAKLRAARRLWARVLELSGASTGSTTGGAEQRLHAVTSRPMMTRYDPYVNMLRGTVAAFAAGVGGADAITVLPFDSALGQPEGFGRRIARNVSHLLIEESHVAAVADPAGGSYAVEKLTDDLAVAGWAEFGMIEEAGGIEAALGDGSLQARIDDVVARREAQIAHRKRPITGVSEFPNLAEQLPERASTGSTTNGRDEVRRYAASYEALRDAPVAQPVFLATLGTIAEHTARATFATNLFAAGGIDVAVAGATAGVADLLAAYDGQPVVCLTGADDTYADWGAAAADALREAGAQHVIIAGVSTSSTAGVFDVVDASCAMGVDALAFLEETKEKLA